MDAGLEALMVFFSALGGSAVTAFWRKKAENWATKQDVAELTEIAKRVEGKISHELMGSTEEMGAEARCDLRGYKADRRAR
jgi:hypothetical protein